MSTKFIISKNSPISISRNWRKQSIALALRQLSESVTLWLDDAGISYDVEIKTTIVCPASADHDEEIVMARIITIDDDDDALVFAIRWPECELG